MADAEMITIHWRDESGEDQWKTLVGGFDSWDDLEYAVDQLIDAYSGELA